MAQTRDWDGSTPRHTPRRQIAIIGGFELFTKVRKNPRAALDRV
jgi:hypothetical protein